VEQAKGWVWRSGSQLVMHRLAVLPNRCLKSNEPTEHLLKRKLRWQPSWVYILLLLNIIIYAIVSAIVSQSADIVIGLNDYWYRKRRQRMAIAWSGILLCVIGFIVGVSSIDRGEPWAPLVIIASLLAVVGFAIYGLLACRLITAAKIDQQLIWIKGVHPDYLASLPEWPYALK
jgi:cell division protein FtsW (lipid II flippase)